MQGILITIEGLDGSGKTSMARKLIPLLIARSKVPLLFTKEPGGTFISDSITKVLLDPTNINMDVKTEFLLYAASRRQHFVEKILPALEGGQIVICDRFVDSSIIYQGIGRNIEIDEIKRINNFTIEKTVPDFTILLDVSVDVALNRVSNRLFQVDRLDLESKKFHEKIRQGYLLLAKMNQNRIAIINADLSMEKVIMNCYEKIISRFSEFFI